MTRTISEHAHVAKLIRQELKKHGVKSRVKSESYAGGSSVRVELENPIKATYEQVSKFCEQFQEGHFNGMEDIYEYSNSNADIPQVKFVFVNANYNEERKQAAWDFILETMGGFEDAPKDYTEAGQVRVHNDWGQSWIQRALSGSLEGFWTTQKPRIKLEA